MSTQVGRLAKNKIVKGMSGNIIDWFNEEEGGWIIQKGVVINQEAWNKHVQKEQDRLEAAKAVGMAKIREDYPEQAPHQMKKVEELETKVTAMDDKLNKILEALSK